MFFFVDCILHNREDAFIIISDQKFWFCKYYLLDNSESVDKIINKFTDFVNYFFPR